VLGCPSSSGGSTSLGRAGARKECVAVRITLEVVLILGLGLPEGTGPADLGHDLPRPDVCGVQLGDRVLGDPALLVARIEDLGAIAGSDEVFAEVGSVDL
jgi:hypothetical protein